MFAGPRNCLLSQGGALTHLCRLMYTYGLVRFCYFICCCCCCTQETHLKPKVQQPQTIRPTVQNSFSAPFSLRLKFSGHCEDLLQADVTAGLPEILHSRRGLGVPHLHQHSPDGAQVSLHRHTDMAQPHQALWVESTQDTGLFTPDPLQQCLRLP